MENSEQHDNQVLSTQGAGQFSKACFVSLTWTMAPRDANIDTLSSKISGVQSERRAKKVVLWIDVGLLLKK